MTVPIEDHLRTFATTLLERRGVLVDWPANERSGTALLSLEAASAVGAADEVVPLGFELAGEGLSLNLAGDFLQWANRLLEAEPRVGVFRVRGLYLKRKEVAEGIGRVFSWLNAKVKVQDVREATIEYHHWWFHGTLTSEDRWETRFPVALNAASGVEVATPDPLGLLELEPRPSAPTSPDSYPRALAAARRRLLSSATEFLQRMDARLLRDRKRLDDYYQALLRESPKKKTRGPNPPDPEKVESSKRAVQLELRRKLLELDQRYAVSAALEPLILVRTETQVIAVDLSVHRKQAQKAHTVYWNPWLKQFEPMLCGCCGQGAFGVAFTNEEVEPRCPNCDARGKKTPAVKTLLT
jgi:hypothetical protein